MRLGSYPSSLSVLLILAAIGGCMNIQKVDQPPGTLQQNIRDGELIHPGDRIAVVSSRLGERIFVVTEVDEEAVHGQGIEVPIDDVVALEKREFDPLLTGLAIYGGIWMLPFAFFGVLIFASLLGL